MRNGRSSLFTITEVDNDIRVDHRIDVAHLGGGVPEEAIDLTWMVPPSHDPGSKETTTVAIGQQEAAVVGNLSAGSQQRSGCDRRVVDIKWNMVMPRVFARRVTPQTVGFHFAQEEIEGTRSYARGG